MRNEILPGERISKRLLVWVSVLVFCVAGLWFPAAAAGGDLVLEKMDQARKAYENKNYDAAARLLQEALGLIQSKMGESLKSFFPKAPEGWVAGRIDDQSGSVTTAEGGFQHTSVSRIYTRRKDQAKVKITITDSPQLIQPYQQMWTAYKQNPMVLSMMAQQGAAAPKLEEKQGWRLLIIPEEGSDRVELIAMHGRVMVNIEKGNEETARKFLGLMDLKGLAQAGNK